VGKIVKGSGREGVSKGKRLWESERRCCVEVCSGMWRCAMMCGGVRKSVEVCDSVRRCATVCGRVRRVRVRVQLALLFVQFLAYLPSGLDSLGSNGPR
jgi:hypothetical protein